MSFLKVISGDGKSIWVNFDFVSFYMVYIFLKESSDHFQFCFTKFFTHYFSMLTFSV